MSIFRIRIHRPSAARADVALGESEDTARTVLVGITGVAANVGAQAANGVAGIASLSEPNWLPLVLTQSEIVQTAREVGHWQDVLPASGF